MRIVRIVEGTNDVVINSIVDKKGSEKGDNFMSDLCDVHIVATIQGTKKDYHWMIKSTPRERNRFLLSRIFTFADEREVKFFRDFLPRMTKFPKEKGKGHLVPGFCEVPFPSWSDEDKVLVMQNLQSVGFRDAINKKAGLNLEHTEMGLKWLAEFHALTYAYLDQCVGDLEALRRSDLSVFEIKFFDIPNVDLMMGGFSGLIEKTLLITLDQIEKTIGGNNYVERFKSFAKQHEYFFKPAYKLRDSYDTNLFKIKTINHGDPWFNNMMFKYGVGDESGSPKEVRFIDMQLTTYVPLVMDLCYFICSSTTGDLTKKSSAIASLLS